jgi:hypothetical protein
VVVLPGIVGTSEERVLALPVIGGKGKIALASDDGSGLLEALDQDSVLNGIVFLEPRDTDSRSQSLGIPGVFDRDGNAVERTRHSIAGEDLVCPVCLLTGFFQIHRDDCIDGGVVLFDSLNEGLENLSRTGLTFSDPTGKLRSRELSESHHRGLGGSGLVCFHPTMVAQSGFSWPVFKHKDRQH